MAESLADKYGPLLSAASFMARAHRHQLRKDNQTPYAAHPFRVCLIARHVFGIEDPQVLTAALLHDTVEDTTTDRDDLIEHYGAEVADWVSRLSKDKRLPDEEREEAYMQTLSSSPAAVQICKLADIFDNLLDSAHFSAEKRKKTIKRSRKYLDALESNLADSANPALAIVKQLISEIKAAQ